jgi:3-isopropylmalate/(R)-2-methylmalate dehydratase large subunit
MPGQSLFEKIWNSHLIHERPDGNALICVDRILLHEGAASALATLRQRGQRVRRPDNALAITDHWVPSDRETRPIPQHVVKMIKDFASEAQFHNIEFLGPDHPEQGIVHVVGAESGFIQPGRVVICGDSHTSTNGAFASIAFGVGVTQITQALAVQGLWLRKPRQMRVTVDGVLPFGVTAKDIILAIIGKIGTAGGTGFAIEFSGTAIGALDMESRMTICNMAIEAGARFGLVAPDDRTFDWMKGRRFAPTGDTWDAAVAMWKDLVSDADAAFDVEVTLDATSLEPMVTWGTSPEDVLPITGAVPDPEGEGEPRLAAMKAKLAYMGLQPNLRLQDIEVDRVFIGSCTNSRLGDLRAAAAVVKGSTVKVTSLVVPGSQSVKAAAEREGLDRVFTEAGFVWGAPGCSMCCGLNGDLARSGERVASTSNRNFEGRQGRGARTHLMSPEMAAAAAITGKLTDVREVIRQ